MSPPCLDEVEVSPFQLLVDCSRGFSTWEEWIAVRLFRQPDLEIAALLAEGAVGRFRRQLELAGAVSLKLLRKVRELFETGGG